VAEAKSEFDKRGVPVLVISFAKAGALASYQEQRHWPFAIFADPERKAYRAFSLKRFSRFQVFSPATLLRYFQLLRNGMKQSSYGGDDIFQGGGDFLIDRNGNILFAHRSRNPADRPKPEAVLREIDRTMQTDR
jgi:peroxiredoxin